MIEREVVLLPDEVTDEMWILRLLMLAGVAEGKREGKQLISRGMIHVDGEKMLSPDRELPLRDGMTIEKKGHEKVRLLLPS